MLKVLTLCGGQAIRIQEASLRHGAHFVVGTPGRVQDHLNRSSLNLKSIDTLVLDEADRMLEMGFADTLDEIISYTNKKRQTLLFSATYPENIRKLGEKYQKNAQLIQTDLNHTNENIEQLFLEVEEKNKMSVLR